MIKVISMTPAAPVERLVDVTVTLTLPESKIAAHRRDSNLGSWLSDKFAAAIDVGDYANGQDVYIAADKIPRF